MKRSKWRMNPQGTTYRICWGPEFPRGWIVEYKPRVPQPPTRTLTSFIVRVRRSTFHVKSSNAEAAASLFMSNTFKHYPKKEEIEVQVDESVH